MDFLFAAMYGAFNKCFDAGMIADEPRVKEMLTPAIGSVPVITASFRLKMRHLVAPLFIYVSFARPDSRNMC